ncbi:MAG: hypothetical protein QOE45_1725 [Frankiaceae bacterium]|jgi:hypothetical protein|nr:hypothetical protein [Frankiaceae bacterium]
MRPTRILASLLLAGGLVALVAPAEAGQVVCKYYYVYNPVTGRAETYDLTWCPV